ncbi:MAG TPA: hypothetical protein VK618_07960 [Flavitalea sp.]|nr:hypothetical protein [Flavitalea sp.]
MAEHSFENQVGSDPKIKKTYPYLWFTILTLIAIFFLINVIRGCNGDGVRYGEYELYSCDTVFIHDSIPKPVKLPPTEAEREAIIKEFLKTHPNTRSEKTTVSKIPTIISKPKVYNKAPVGVQNNAPIVGNNNQIGPVYNDRRLSADQIFQFGKLLDQLEKTNGYVINKAGVKSSPNANSTVVTQINDFLTARGIAIYPMTIFSGPGAQPKGIKVAEEKTTDSSVTIEIWPLPD